MLRSPKVLKMTGRFEDILTKEEAYIKRSDNKEENKAEGFKLLMEVTKQKQVLEEKRVKIEEKNAMIEEKNAMLEEKKVKIAADVEDAKMLTLNLEDLDDDTRMIVQAVGFKMLQRQKDELERVEQENMEAVEKEAEAEAAYTATTAD